MSAPTAQQAMAAFNAVAIFNSGQTLAQIEQAFLTYPIDTLHMTKRELAIYEAVRAWVAGGRK